MGGGVFHRQGDLFAHALAHAAHEEAAVHHHHHGGLALNAAHGADHGLVQPGFLFLHGQLFAVTGKVQRVVAGYPAVQLPEAAVVQHHAQAVIAADGLVLAAVGAHVQVLGPDGAGGPALALGAGEKLGRLPGLSRALRFPAGLPFKGLLAGGAADGIQQMDHERTSLG